MKYFKSEMAQHTDHPVLSCPGQHGLDGTRFQENESQKVIIALLAIETLTPGNLLQLYEFTFNQALHLATQKVLIPSNSAERLRDRGILTKLKTGEWRNWQTR